MLQSFDFPPAPLPVVLILKNISRHFLGAQRADRVFLCPEDNGSHSIFPRLVGIVGLTTAVTDKLHFLCRRRAHLQSQFGLHRV